jgi:hypothetical protein
MELLWHHHDVLIDTPIKDGLHLLGPCFDLKCDSDAGSMIWQMLVER